ncbi:hypothetical protein ACFSC4_26170 [Deinococcus malanensis]|uniref:hypothetical protein n=1 Tax=Deinococcus malanensis TaxID=1706855 RepID=UPI003641E30B
MQHNGVRLAALRHHETRDTVRLMAQSDDDLKAQGIAPDSLPALLLVSAWSVHPEALEAILEGEVPAPSFLPPGDFEWHPTAYQQLHLSLTRSELQEQAPTVLPASPK